MKEIQNQGLCTKTQGLHRSQLGRPLFIVFIYEAPKTSNDHYGANTLSVGSVRERSSYFGN